MTNYYHDQKKAFNDLNEILDRCIREKRSVNIPSLIYQFSLLYPVSSKSIRNQIKIFVETRKLRIENEEIIIE